MYGMYVHIATAISCPRHIYPTGIFGKFVSSTFGANSIAQWFKFINISNLQSSKDNISNIKLLGCYKF